MTVRLTLDANIQQILEKNVAAAVKHFKAESGVGLVMNPKTGEVLAMASNPTYDLNAPGDAPAAARTQPRPDRPVRTRSTFKPFVASAALVEKVVHPGEILDCENGSYTSNGRTLNDHHPYGALTFEQIVIKSSNVGMGKLGERLGNERIHRYLCAASGFGFGARTGIDLPGEDPGILLPLRVWTTYSTTSLPMGQEIAVTPMQLATAFGAIVNGGKLLQPRIVRAIIDPRGNVVDEFKDPKVVRQVIPKEVAD